jgi:hypothetical protein
MITLNTTIRTANELQWNICSLPHSGEHVQVAYTLTLDGEVIEQGIKTLEGVIVNGTLTLNAITEKLVEVLNEQ